MNQIRNDNRQPEFDTMDGILASEEELFPSSGFTASVMDRIQEEARTPAPIRFPWKRAIPGIVLTAGVFGWGAVVFVRQAIPAVRAFSFTEPQVSIPTGGHFEEAGWIALALAISAVSLLLCRRLANPSEPV